MYPKGQLLSLTDMVRDFFLNFFRLRHRDEAVHLVRDIHTTRLSRNGITIFFDLKGGYLSTGSYSIAVRGRVRGVWV